ARIARQRPPPADPRAGRAGAGPPGASGDPGDALPQGLFLRGPAGLRSVACADTPKPQRRAKHPATAFVAVLAPRRKIAFGPPSPSTIRRKSTQSPYARPSEHRPGRPQARPAQGALVRADVPARLLGRLVDGHHPRRLAPRQLAARAGGRPAVLLRAGRDRRRPHRLYAVLCL